MQPACGTLKRVCIGAEKGLASVAPGREHVCTWMLPANVCAAAPMPAEPHSASNLGAKELRQHSCLLHELFSALTCFVPRA